MRACRGTSAANPGCGLTRDIAAIRLSYRPVSMQSRRFRADIEHANGQRISVLSTTWQTVTLMTPQDNDYRAFITELHRRLEAGGKQGRAGRRIEAGPLCRRRRGAGAGGDRHHRTARARGRHRRIGGALFLIGFAALFGWQIGGFVRRNRPRRYTFDELPEELLP